MIIIDYDRKNHKTIIHACVKALKQGKAVVYPTDTCYGLAVDTGNLLAIKKLYKVKGRNFNKPISIIPSSVSYAKKIVLWNKTAEKLAKKFWPGPLTIILDLRFKDLKFKNLSAGTGTVGVRMPDDKIALDLSKYLKKPITSTSANVSGKPDCYSAEEVLHQFRNQKYKPDIIINVGKLIKQRPSTLIKINQDSSIKILRKGPISMPQIHKILNLKS